MVEKMNSTSDRRFFRLRVLGFFGVLGFSGFRVLGLRVLGLGVLKVSGVLCILFIPHPTSGVVRFEGQSGTHHVTRRSQDSTRTAETDIHRSSHTQGAPLD